LLTEEVRTVSMKAQLIVVRGKPEGKVIPLAGPTFKIGRGETCHLRPNSEQVSREHAEFTLQGGAVIVRDLGSRNGTLVNGKALTTEACKLKDRDLVQVGPLTFAVSIQEAPAPAAAAAAKPAAAAPPAAAKAKSSPEDISTDDIDSWLLGENAGAAAEQPTAVYGGDTITIAAFKDAQAAPQDTAKPSPAPPANKPPSVADDDEYERQSEDEEEAQAEEELADSLDEDESEEEEEGEGANLEEEFMDESNPFYAAKKAQKEQAKKGGTTGAAGNANATFKDSSDAANEILRKLMERRRASKS
jgi:pSer/pThr/pTyr-binding forkhead associated (FHA) protein